MWFSFYTGQLVFQQSLSRFDKSLGNSKEKMMPLVNIDVIEGVFTAQQKQDMIRNVTDTMVAIEGENLRGVTWVKINEVKTGDWGIGGKMLSSGDVKAMAGR